MGHTTVLFDPEEFWVTVRISSSSPTLWGESVEFLREQTDLRDYLRFTLQQVLGREQLADSTLDEAVAGVQRVLAKAAEL